MKKILQIFKNIFSKDVNPKEENILVDDINNNAEEIKEIVTEDIIMKTSEKGIRLIKHFEGFRSEAYLDPVGIWTIGYGTIENVRKGMTVTEEQATNLLLDHLKDVERDVRNVVVVELNQDQFDALVSFVYNLGIGNLKSSTLLKRLNQGNYQEASNQFLRWNKGRVDGVLTELSGLTRRRKAEKKLFDTGILDI